MSNDFFYKNIQIIVEEYLASERRASYLERESRSDATKKFLLFEFETEDERDSDSIDLPIALFTYCLAREQTNPDANRLYAFIIYELTENKNENVNNYEVPAHYSDFFCQKLTGLLKTTLDANPSKIVDPALFIKDIEQILNKLFSNTPKAMLDKAQVLLNSGFIDYLAKNDKEQFAKEMLLNNWLVLLNNNILPTEQKINEKDFGDYYHLYLSKENHLTTRHLNKISDNLLELLYKKGIHTKLAQMLAKELGHQSPWVHDYSRQIPDYHPYRTAITRIMAAKPSNEPAPPLSDDMKIINSFFKNSTDIKNYIVAPELSASPTSEFKALDTFFSAMARYALLRGVQLGTNSAASTPHWEVACTYILVQVIQRATIDAATPNHPTNRLIVENSPFRHLASNSLRLSTHYQTELSNAIPSAFAGLYISNSIFKAFEQGKIQNIAEILAKFIHLDALINHFLTSFDLDFKKIILGHPVMPVLLSNIFMDLLMRATVEQRVALQKTMIYKTLATDNLTKSIAVYEDTSEPPTEVSDFLKNLNQAAYNYTINPRHGLKYLFTSGNTSNIECAQSIMHIYEQKDKALNALLPEMLRVIIKYRLTSYKEKETNNDNEPRKYEKKFYTYLFPILSTASAEIKNHLKEYKNFSLTVINPSLSYIKPSDYTDPEKARSLKDSIDLFFDICDIKPDDLLVTARFTFDNLQRKVSAPTGHMVLTNNRGASTGSSFAALATLATLNATRYFNPLNAFSAFSASSSSNNNNSNNNDDDNVSTFEMLSMQ
jgi:hypothetical protein